MPTWSSANGKIVAINDEQPRAYAVAIASETILFVGSNQIVLYSTEEYIKDDLPNIMKHLRQHVDADARISDEHVQIICDLGVKKFEGRALRKLIGRE